MSPEPVPGDLIAGKFRVERVLGRGGMGVVLAARHTELAERFAIKIIHAERSGDAVAVERFRREARAAARLRGEHVARVSDFGMLDDGTPYLVMEYLSGPTLSQVLRRDGPLSIERAASLVIDACAGLAEAHALGIVHRDVKPGNLLLAERPDGTTCVKILDFGIAKTSASAASSGTLTGTTAALGSPAYMSPEQVRDPRSVDAKTDVWALGVVLYEAVSGRHPFEAFTTSGLLAAIVADPPTPLRSVAPRVAPELEAVIAACLEKDRDARPDVGALAIRLGALAGRDAGGAARILSRPERTVTHGGLPMPPVIDDVTTEAPSALTRDPALTTGGRSLREDTRVTPRGPSTLRIALGGAAVVALSFAAAFAWLRRPEGPPPSAAPSAPSPRASEVVAPPAPVVTPVESASARAEAPPPPAKSARSGPRASTAPPSPPAPPRPAAAADSISIPGFGGRL